MPGERFVVLRHEPGESGPRALHWDLMLEQRDGLRTWALESEPQIGQAVMATELPLHRKDYLDYEGPVSRGRGTVIQFDRGTYQVISEADDEIVLQLDGKQLVCQARLMRKANRQRWSVEFSSV